MGEMFESDGRRIIAAPAVLDFRCVVVPLRNENASMATSVKVQAKFRTF